MPDSGLCECGCGGHPAIAKRTNATYGYVEGKPRRFLPGHGSSQPMDQNGRWRGGRSTNHGYVRVKAWGHPRASNTGYVFEHILVVERALGKPLPLRAKVHHVDGDKTRNVGGNLVACEDQAYHTLLHQRQRALDACGDANARRCSLCAGYDRQTEIAVYGSWAVHRSCHAARERKRRAS